MYGFSWLSYFVFRAGADKRELEPKDPLPLRRSGTCPSMLTKTLGFNHPRRGRVRARAPAQGLLPVTR